MESLIFLAQNNALSVTERCEMQGTYPELKSKIEKVLSEILSDKYECKVTLRFEKKGADQ